VSEDVEGVTGKYFVDCMVKMCAFRQITLNHYDLLLQETKTSVDAMNKDLAKKLWDKCVEFVKLTPSELKSVT